MQGETHREMAADPTAVPPQLTEERMAYVVLWPMMLGLSHDSKSAILGTFARDLSQDKADPKFGRPTLVSFCYLTL